MHYFELQFLSRLHLSIHLYRTEAPSYALFLTNSLSTVTTSFTSTSICFLKFTNLPLVDRSATPKAIIKPRMKGRSKVKCEDADTPANLGKKRKRVSKQEPETHDKEEDEYEELPHNMGKVKKAKKVAVKSEDDAAAKPSLKKQPTKKSAVKNKEEAMKPSSLKKRATKAQIPSPSKAAPKKTPAKPRATSPTSEKKPKTPSKKETYGLTEGISPFPNYARPSPEECYKVAELLRAAHPDCKPRPKTISEPSKIVAGCGEVPSILDAMIRTLLSAATSGRNSSAAYQGMVTRYGIRKTGVGAGSVDYNAVRLAPQAHLQEAISSGGLAKNKSENIKAILDMVYTENQERRKANLAAKATNDDAAGAKGALTEEQKDAEIALAEDDNLSLDHLYYLPTYEAISKFIKYPGIGVKTAACVSLFCMQRDCFAVDTHVFRLCQWLTWVPDQGPGGKNRAKGDKKVDRDTTFSHLEVRIPDELKYDLHQLFISHGKNCPRCIAITGQGSARWEEGCPIEELVKRTGARKEGGSPAKKAAKKAVKKRTNSESEDEEEFEDEDD